MCFTEYEHVTWPTRTYYEAQHVSSSWSTLQTVVAEHQAYIEEKGQHVVSDGHDIRRKYGGVVSSILSRLCTISDRYPDLKTRENLYECLVFTIN